MKHVFFISVLLALFCRPVHADGPSEAAVSPKPGWGDFDVVEEEVPNESPTRKALLWLPNRVLDFIDIFHVDVGAGAAVGGVVRASKYVQIGQREVDPFTLRVGAFGRHIPFRLETEGERGLVGDYKNSTQREVCKGEVGLGLDLGLGAYAGICVDEFFDFVGGIFTLDTKNDDLR